MSKKSPKTRKNVIDAVIKLICRKSFTAANKLALDYTLLIFIHYWDLYTIIFIHQRSSSPRCLEPENSRVIDILLSKFSSYLFHDNQPHHLEAKFVSRHFCESIHQTEERHSGETHLLRQKRLQVPGGDAGEDPLAGHDHLENAGGDHLDEINILGHHRDGETRNPRPKHRVNYFAKFA